jgi:hypothetical protein
MAQANLKSLTGDRAPLGLKRIPAFTGKETLKEAAHMWAAAGAAVIPLARGTKSPGKLLGVGWQHQATNDPAQVEAWFSRTDVGGIAIECGKSGVVVVDVDQNVVGVNGGVVEHTRGLDDLHAHRYFQMPEDKEIGNSKKGLDGFKGDVRGHGGCVVVYPTPHPDGGQYIFRPEALGAEIPPLPEEIKAILPERSAEADPCSLQDALHALTEGSSLRDDYLLTKYLERFDNRVSRGESRHDAALKTMCNLFRDTLKGRAGEAEYEAVYNHIFDAMTLRYDDRRAKTDGEARADLERCTSWAYSQAVATWHEEMEAGAADALSPVGSMDSRWQLMEERELDQIEFPPDLVHESLPAVGIGQLYGDSMAGKTFIAIDLAYRITRGLPWFGREVEQPGDVVYLYKEGAKSVQARARAWRRKYGKTPKDAPGRVIFISGAGMFSEEKDLRALEGALAAKGIRPRLIMGDTQALLLETRDENDNAEAAKHTRLLKSWAERMGCLVLLLHHTVKSGDVANGARGAGGWKGQADSLITVVRDPETGARQLRVKKYKDGAEWERGESFRIQQVGEHSSEAVLVATGAVDVGELARKSVDPDLAYVRAVHALGADATAVRIGAQCGVVRNSASRALGRIVERGLLARGPGNTYVLTADGEEFVAAHPEGDHHG